ncbi:SDR family NAD(P)-dependent oxidoreductase, partial [Tepidiforma sp.]|uniref:SDR family NAD(P)-dependent oxidoreductase n=1 Tax=Tepidiforma sp. TaxID=2682230 RepID=UPI0026275CC2
VRVGRVICLALAGRGVHVAFTHLPGEPAGETAAEIAALGVQALAMPLDVREHGAPARVVGQVVDRFGRLDILVNNAATNPIFCSTAEVEEAAYDKIMEVNVKGLFFLSQQVGKIMCEKGSGSVINVSSEAGFCPTPFLGVYSISKAAVNMLTKVFAQEWGSKGVRVNAIAKGLVKTHFSQALWG